jgi:hypothetical protein
MKITIFTSNHKRHNYLINLLAEIADELFVIQESRTLFPGINTGIYKVSPIIETYFNKVSFAEEQIFGNQYINAKQIKLISLAMGDLNLYPIHLLSDFLKSDLYIVFGASFIQGELANKLIKENAINIHMGVSPYYRGADCNFWALKDNNPHLVGATIHKLSEGLDSGDILYHALSTHKINPYEYTMSTVKSAFYSLRDRINDKSIFNIEALPQNKQIELRYSRRKDFNEVTVKEFLDDEINLDLNHKNFDLSLYKDPYFLE